MGLLEREEPLASLAACADEARRGQGRLVLVSGEAGVGKSALVERFTAGLNGHAVLPGGVRRAVHAAAARGVP